MVLVIAREGVGVEVWAETQKNVIAKTLNWDRQKKHQYVIRSCSLKSVFSNRSREERRKDHQDIPAYLFLQILIFLSFSVSFSLSPRFVCFTHSLVGGVTGLALSAADGRWYPFTQHTHTQSLTTYAFSCSYEHTVSFCMYSVNTNLLCVPVFHIY